MKVQEKQKIHEGDIVRVDFNNAQITLCHRAIVLYIPCAVGDSWHFEDMDTGNIHYVNESCTITRFIDKHIEKDKER